MPDTHAAKPRPRRFQLRADHMLTWLAIDSTVHPFAETYSFEDAFRSNCDDLHDLHPAQEGPS